MSTDILSPAATPEPSTARSTAAAPTTIDLAGAWTAVPDPARIGESAGWFRSALTDAAEHHTISLPGSAQLQGIGSAPTADTQWVGAPVDHPFFTDERYAPYRDPENVKVPFFLQPERVYVGEVWYQREIEIPAEWAGSDVEVFLERAHWESAVWLDDRRLGSQRSLSTPHRYVVQGAEPGIHRLTVRIDNATILDVGTNAHSISDHTQGGWNGVVGELSLRRLSPVRLTTLEVHPDAGSRSVRVRATITADSLRGAAGTLTLAARLRGGDRAEDPAPHEVAIEVESERFTRGVTSTSAHLDVEYRLGDDARLWDEFSPAVYDLHVRLEATSPAGTSIDERDTVFGLRSVTASGTSLLVNDRPTFLRGTLDCCIFPLTGYPPTDVDSWARIFRTCQAYGLNHVRFHSWCPPEAAFVAADEAGVYLQVEGPVWANQGAALGQGGDLDAYIYEESWRIVREFGDHPSFVLLAHGNEPNGRDAEFLGQWVAHWRRRDARRLYTTAAGWPVVPENDYDCIPDPRLQLWGAGLDSRVNAQAPETLADYSDLIARSPRPTVTHEAGQWCVYPSIAEIDKYTGVMRPTNLEIVRDFLAQGGMLDQAGDFVQASGRLQVLLYKEELEAMLRTPGQAGVQLLGLQDFPGQGTAPVGVVDAFWDPKGYVDADEFSRFCAPTVPLALLPARTFTTDQTLTAGIRVAHYGAAETTARLSWTLRTSAGATIAEGGEDAVHLPLGVSDHGTVEVDLGGVDRAEHLRLEITVADDAGTHANDWDLWVYPAAGAVDADDAVLVTSDTDAALRALETGASVLLCPPRDEIVSPVEFGFSTVFWNTSWTSGQAPHTLGILCDPAHPALAGFPTASHTDWQWWDVLHDAQALHLSALPSSRPVVQAIDSWFDARRLGLLVEARVGSGRLLLSGMDLVTDLARRPVARQLRASVAAYAASDACVPELELSPGQVRDLIADRLA